jgi:glycosyltransferase involved in cell wall biosynthesis
VSFVLPCRNEGNYLRQTVESLLATTAGVPAEIIVVDNGSTDGCSDFLRRDRPSTVRLLRSQPLGVVGARTRGFEEARGEFLFFCDAHVTFSPGWLEPCLEVLARPEVGLVAPASAIWGHTEPAGFGMRWTDARFGAEWLGKQGDEPYPIPMAAGFCTGMRRAYFAEIGYDRGMEEYGMEDLEICLRIWLLGQQVIVVPGAVCAHLFREAHPYDVSWRKYLVNAMRTAIAHFHSNRLGRCLAEWKTMCEFEEAFADVLSSDIWRRREDLFARRRYNDDWFFQRFGLGF